MALHCASSRGHTDVVELLLNHNAKLNVVTKVTHINHTADIDVVSHIMRMSVLYYYYKPLICAEQIVDCTCYT